MADNNNYNAISNYGGDILEEKKGSNKYE